MMFDIGTIFFSLSALAAVNEIMFGCFHCARQLAVGLVTVATTRNSRCRSALSLPSCFPRQRLQRAGPRGSVPAQKRLPLCLCPLTPWSTGRPSNKNPWPPPDRPTVTVVIRFHPAERCRSAREGRPKIRPNWKKFENGVGFRREEPPIRPKKKSHAIGAKFFDTS